VGLFSLFGKKDRSPDSPDEDTADGTAEASRFPQVERRVASRPPPNQIERRVAARATAMKIDAIETEMARDILAPVASTATVSPPPASASATVTAGPASTLVPLESNSELLPDDDGLPLSTIEVSAGGSSQDMEEAAILFASKQYALAESMLRQALLGESNWREPNRAAWWMLFDLYQIWHRQADFESLSIDYAGLFETSPPSWNPDLYPEQAPADATPKRNAIPAIAFSGRLDLNIVPQLKRLQALPAGQPCRLEFARVTEVEPSGCALLLSALQEVRKTKRVLILTGADDLVGKVRAIVKIGRLDETATTWLLLLEILRLLNREQEFEEASIDYCVTFEVSPPQFEAPLQAPAAVVQPETVAPSTHPDRFQMPTVIEGDCSQLLQDLLAYAEKHQPVRLDCTHLARIEFVAAGKLLNQLAPLTATGKTIEFHQVNHLIIALFNMMGLSGIAKIVPRRY
jgi:ABC-type transporter Mla MlaB component